MTDTFDAATRSWVMSRVLSRGTKPELAVRAALKACPWRVQRGPKRLPGHPDFVIPELRLAVFVNGCFWHWHGCPRCRMPQANRRYWTRKIERNVRRDRRSKRSLTAAGWHYWTVWECRLSQGVTRLLARINMLGRQTLTDSK
jgi:DNA mismatch endonuclease (patch repair protein)